MTRGVATVMPDASLRDAASVLVERRVSGVPVVGAQGEVVGVLSEADIVTKAGGRTERSGLLTWLFDPELETAKVTAKTAGEAMSAPALTIGSGKAVHEAARLMPGQKIRISTRMICSPSHAREHTAERPRDGLAADQGAHGEAGSGSRGDRTPYLRDGEDRPDREERIARRKENRVGRVDRVEDTGRRARIRSTAIVGRVDIVLVVTAHEPLLERERARRRRHVCAEIVVRGG